MPTYGLLKAMEHPVNHALKELKREIARLQGERDAIMNACDHHFIPEKDALTKLKQTKVFGVYHAESVGELSAVSDVIFSLVCTQCGSLKSISVSNRCPICAAETNGKWGSSDDLGRYFGEGRDFGYNGLWLISCTNCDFKAAGLRWDQ